MPELPEVETTRSGVSPHIKNQQIDKLIIRNGNLRWEVPKTLPRKVKNLFIGEPYRRGKYLLFPVCKTKGSNSNNGSAIKGHMIIHLGMSGSLRIVSTDDTPEKHDHVDLVLANGKVLRLCDPRRFGAWLWTEADPLEHALLSNLGPEPLGEDFTADYLWQKAKNRKTTIKQFLMDSKVVVGVGNIYANESLFLSGIHPKRLAGRISRERYQVLVDNIKQVLSKAIECGGTTLKDFVGGDGKPGYFQQQLFVYGRGGEPCTECGEVLKEIQLAKRTTVYCSTCQN